MSRHLQREIAKLKKKILEVGKAVKASIAEAIRSVREHDAKLAKSIIDKDIQIDRMEVDTEEECLKILALHQPVAIDLRFIVGVLKMNSDLERMADLAANIAERSVDLALHKGKVSIPPDLFVMASRVNSMVENSMRAMIDMDVRLAREVCSGDDEVDELHKRMFTYAKKLMAQDKRKIDTSVMMLSISRYLERIADHATNIAEDVIYMVEGTIHRHTYKATDRKA